MSCSRVWALNTPVAAVMKPSAVRSCWSAVTSLPLHAETQHAAAEGGDARTWSSLCLRVVAAGRRGGRSRSCCSWSLVVASPVVHRRGSRPRPYCESRRTRWRLLRIGANRSQLLKYDKPTLSLSCAYGVSCRARAERVCATPLSMWRFAPRAAIAAQQLVPPLRVRNAVDRTRLGVLAGSITACQHESATSRRSTAPQLVCRLSFCPMSEDYTPQQVADCCSRGRRPADRRAR